MISTLTRYMISKSTRYKPLFEAVEGRHASGRDRMILMWQSSQCWSPAWDGRISSSLSTPGHRVSQDKKINVSPQNIIECGIWIMTIWYAWLTLRVQKIYNLNIGEKIWKHCLCIFLPWERVWSSHVSPLGPFLAASTHVDCMHSFICVSKKVLKESHSNCRIHIGAKTMKNMPWQKIM